MKNAVKSVSLVSMILAAMMMSTLAIGQGRGYGNRDGSGSGWRQGLEADSAFQRGPAYCAGIPDLSADQQAKIKKSKLAFDKDALAIRNQRDEKQARLKTLKTADKVDNQAIDKTIDEIASLNAQLAKKRNLHQQEIRSLLTEEQRIMFDSRQGKGKRFAKEGKRGRGQGHGRGGWNN